MSFTGTLDKCTACEKTVYVVDMLTLEGMPYHKSCFKCTHCKGTLTVCVPVLCYIFSRAFRVNIEVSYSKPNYGMVEIWYGSSYITSADFWFPIIYKVSCCFTLFWFWNCEKWCNPHQFLWSLGMVKCFPSFLRKIQSLIVHGRWTPIHPWMECSTAGLILSNFSRSLAISARIFRKVVTFLLFFFSFF